MKEYQLLMSALVAVVAIVGLVVQFSGPTGALNTRIYQAPAAAPRDQTTSIGVDPAFYRLGYEEIAPVCVDVESSYSKECCSRECLSACEGRNSRVGGRTVADCTEQCISGCGLGRRELVQTS